MLRRGHKTFSPLAQFREQKLAPPSVQYGLIVKSPSLLQKNPTDVCNLVLDLHTTKRAYALEEAMVQQHCGHCCTSVERR
jgi:hypothetical protein